MVFITDVRRGNLHMHLMYKALFELTNNRADFFALLFNKQRPDGPHGQELRSPEIVNAFWDVPTSAEAVYKANLKRDPGPPDARLAALPLSAGRPGRHRVHLLDFYWYGMRDQLQLLVDERPERPRREHMSITAT